MDDRRLERESGPAKRVADGDAVEVLRDMLPSQSVTEVRAYFPDPWPKRRHHKRRIVTAELVEEFHRILNPGGLLRFASDSGDYVAWTLILIRAHGGVVWLADGPQDWRGRPADWPETRYEAKARHDGRAPMFLSFRRL